jgi:hypothetical protein
MRLPTYDKPRVVGAPTNHSMWCSMVTCRPEQLAAANALAAQVLGLPRTRIGRIGGGKRKATGQIEVALIHRLWRGR